MQFRTITPIEKYQNPIDYNSQLLQMGSCFVENIGAKFDYFKFKNSVNPFGIIFNPVSIEKIIERVISKSFFTEKDIFFHNDLWHCFEVHSELSNPNKEEFLSKLNGILELTHQHIFKLTHFQITYGTAWVYREKKSNQIVANCHKVPQSQFEKELLSVEIIEKAIKKAFKLIQKINPTCSFIFTVSPVRHIKDGFAENQLSKAHLISAVHTAIKNQPSANYFPSYEIMMDELRDYRFYAEDMLHPNQTAIDYIWVRFFENYINPNCFSLMEEINSVQKSLAHKPFNPDTENHQKFIKKINEKIVKIQQILPSVSF